ncbi:YfiT family bacillithiol transferase [Alkalibacillus almallahensis]|uniref:YfiT family bacillithiol transferase n=1 Tax=Alkalibacillus almallahensis TaxID=1379154 RepID=UPI0014238E91|nr:putative metal-dependent hydrolase [Alkalibacillus almallahensis]NIK13433.1 putative damage-inducible protein DinB [Alkalibacillus almallahensis]
MDVKFPIGQLELPETITLDHIHEWMKDIETYTNRLRETVEGLSESDLEKTYREGSYNVRQLVHHIADSQLNMYQRLKMALTDNNPTVPAFDQDEWAVQPDTKLPVESSIKMLEGINERIVALGKSINEEELSRVFTRVDEGEISVATKLAKLSWHEEHHLEHIKIALEN